MGPFPDELQRVFVAGAEIAQFTFDNDVLQFDVLPWMQKGRILVVCKEHTYLSDGQFNPV